MHDVQCNLCFRFGEPVQPAQQRCGGFGFILRIDDQDQGHWPPEWLIGITAVGRQHVNHIGPLTRRPNTGERPGRADSGRFAGEGVLYGAMQLLFGTRAYCGDAS